MGSVTGSDSVFPLSPQIPALGQEDALQELVLRVDSGELFLLPLDQSWCFLV